MEFFSKTFLSKKIIDITHLPDQDSPFWPTNGNSGFSMCPYNTIEKDRCYSINLKMTAGFGTHIDAPSHFVKEGKTIPDLEVNQLIGTGVIIDIMEKCALDCDYELSIEDILNFENKYFRIPEESIILLKTGWYRFFCNKEKYYNSNSNQYSKYINVGVMHFPGFSKEAAQFLVEYRNCKAIGIDTLSPDKGSSEIFHVHDTLLNNDKYIIENLNLENAQEGFCMLICLPMKIKGLSESPTRVLAIYD